MKPREDVPGEPDGRPQVRESIGVYVDSVVAMVRDGVDLSLVSAGDVAFAQRIVEAERALALANEKLRYTVHAALEAAEAGGYSPVADPPEPESAVDGPTELLLGVPPELQGQNVDVVYQNGEATYYRCDEHGRLILADATNDFLDIVSLPNEDGGGYAARLKADPQHLCADGETVEIALKNLGGLCARLSQIVRDKAPAQPQAAPAPAAPPVKWQYRRKSTEELKAVAQGIVAGTIHMGYGVEEIERGWPTLVGALRQQGINEQMHTAGIVAFYSKALTLKEVSPGRKEFLDCEQLDNFDYSRLQLALNDLRGKPASDPGRASWLDQAMRLGKALRKRPR